MTLEAHIAEAVRRDGLCELILRVSQYGHLSAAMDEPAAWQAIAKYSKRVSGPWGVGVRADPVQAVLAALEAGRNGGTTATGGEEDVFG